MQCPPDIPCKQHNALRGVLKHAKLAGVMRPAPNQTFQSKIQYKNSSHKQYLLTKRDRFGLWNYRYFGRRKRKGSWLGRKTFGVLGTRSTRNSRDLQIQLRVRVRVRVRLLSARGLGLSCRGHCCCRRQLATKIFQ